MTVTVVVIDDDGDVDDVQLLSVDLLTQCDITGDFFLSQMPAFKHLQR